MDDRDSFWPRAAIRKITTHTNTMTLTKIYSENPNGSLSHSLVFFPLFSCPADSRGSLVEKRQFDNKLQVRPISQTNVIQFVWQSRIFFFHYKKMEKKFGK